MNERDSVRRLTDWRRERVAQLMAACGAQSLRLYAVSGIAHVFPAPEIGAEATLEMAYNVWRSG